MKQIALLLFIGSFVILLSLASCDPGKHPNIAFKSGPGYTSANATVGKQDTLLVGIIASKAEKEDVLKRFNESVSYGAAIISLYTEDLTGAQGDNYTKDMQVITRDVVGTEQYTFTVVNRDGLVGQVSLVLQVN